MKSLEISKEDLKHNIKAIQEFITIESPKYKENKYKLIGVVKANGYGLGLIEYSKFLINNGINILAVATLEEAIQLRQAGINEDILMMSSVSIEEDLNQLIENDIIITIGSSECARIVKELGGNTQKKIRAHIKIDTGLGRYGFLYSDIENIINTIKGLSDIKIEGIYSHFSLAYYRKNKWTIKQFERFMNVVESLKLNNINIEMLHICNSPALLNYPEMHLNAARIGSAFLGRVDAENDIGLKEIGRLKTNVTEIKTLPKNFNVGYLNSYKTKRETKIAIVQVRIYGWI